MFKWNVRNIRDLMTTMGCLNIFSVCGGIKPEQGAHGINYKG